MFIHTYTYVYIYPMKPGARDHGVGLQVAADHREDHVVPGRRATL